MSAAVVALTTALAAPTLLVIPLMPRIVGFFEPVDGRPPRQAVPAPEVFAAVTVALVTAVTVALHPHPARLPAYLYLSLAGVVLAAVDLRVHRLPDVIVLPSYLVLTVLLALPALVEGAPGRWTRALAAGAAGWLLYAGLRRIPGSGLGRGDVKLAGLLGLALGWLGWSAAAAGLVAATVIGGLVALALLASGRASRRDPIAYGPFLLAGTLVAVLAAG